MSEFSDQPAYDMVEPGIDISDFVQDSPQETVEQPSLSPTPEPVEGNVDKEPEETPPEDSVKTYGLDDLYKLMESWKESQEAYQTVALENQEYLKDQSKNLLSASILLLFLVGVLTGVLFARVVWRKI